MGELLSIVRHLVNENDAVSHVNGDISAAPDLFDLAVRIGVGDAQHIPISKAFRRVGDLLIHRENQYQSQQTEHPQPDQRRESGGLKHCNQEQYQKQEKDDTA